MKPKNEDEFLDWLMAKVYTMACNGELKDGTYCYSDGELTSVTQEEIDAMKEEVPFSDGDVCPYDGECEECPYEEECAEDCEEEIPFCDNSCMSCFVPWEFEDSEPDMWGIPDVERVVFSDPATIVFWADRTKTVVKCMPGEKFERYAGFMAACMKKMFGSTSRAKKIMNECAVDQVKTEKKKAVAVPDMTAAFCEVIANREAAQEAVNEALRP